MHELLTNMSEHTTPSRVRVPTFDRLLREKIMFHQLDRRVQGHCLGLSENLGQILQHQTARGLRPLVAELREVMAHITSHVNQQNIVVTDSRVDQNRYDVEADIHPARAALVVGGHVVIELGGSLGVLLHEFEEVKGRVEAQLEATVGAAGGVLVVCFLQLGGEGKDTCCDAGGPVV